MIVEEHTKPGTGRLRWRMMRRGLLELDLVFERFLRLHLDSLEDSQLLVLERLLELEDVDLWDMISGRKECEQPEWQDLMALLRTAATGTGTTGASSGVS